MPTGTELAVCQDIEYRQKMGINKYGTTVAENPLELREWLQNAYEEALDLSVYLRRSMEELDKHGVQTCRSNRKDVQQADGGSDDAIDQVRADIQKKMEM